MGAVFVLRPELGIKRTCVGCAARFYDMTRAPPTCPKCGAVQPADVPRPRYAGRGNVAAGGRRAPWQAAPAPVADDAEAVADVVEDEDEDADAVVIDDDDADVSEIDAEIPSRPGVGE